MKPPAKVPPFAAAESTPLRVGDVCEIRGSGEHRGREGKLTALDDDGDAFVQLSGGGGRVVVPISELQRKSTPAETAAAVGAAAGKSAAALDATEATEAPALGTGPPTAEGRQGAGAPRGVGAFSECLELLQSWPEGAHAAAIGLLEEPAATQEPGVRDLVRSLSARMESLGSGDAE